jgi:DNA-binding Xre family transcriptional regulator
MSDIYKKIEAYRKQKEIPKGDFYKKIGYSSVGFKAMSINHSIKLSTLEKIAGVLEISIFELLDYKAAKDMRTKASKENMQPEVYENVSEILELQIPDFEKIELLSEKISQLTLELRISGKLSEARKEQVKKLEIELAASVK